MNIKHQMQKFLCMNAPTIEVANEIEFLLDSFADDDYLAHTQEMLARFRPEGGEYLFKADAIKQRLIDTLEYLDKNNLLQ